MRPVVDKSGILSSPAIRRPLALAGIAAAGVALLASDPRAAQVVNEFVGEVTGAASYYWLTLACIFYSLGLRLVRRLRGYDRWLAGIVMGGVMIVAFAVWGRFHLPLPALTGRSLVLWAARVMAYHFYVASVPIMIWQMAEDYLERREARAFRVQGEVP